MCSFLGSNKRLDLVPPPSLSITHHHHLPQTPQSTTPRASHSKLKSNSFKNSNPIHLIPDHPILHLNNTHLTIYMYSVPQLPWQLDLAFGITFHFKDLGIDFGGQPRCIPSIFEKRPCIYQFLPHFPPKFGFAPPIFFTSLHQCG